MSAKVIFGLLLLSFTIHEINANGHCAATENLDDDSARYPKYPLTFEELRYAVLGGGRTSRTYYEVYSLDPTELKPSGLPILRKVAIRWNLVTEGLFPGNFTNDYVGWSPYRPSTDPCEEGLVVFETMYSSSKFQRFKFLSVYPKVETMVGTSFSSCPERYLINWYCPETEITYTDKSERRIKGCRSGARMSIYSSVGPNSMPWHLIVDDLCKNSSPKMDDKRWTMTYDAPQQCQFGTGRRKKRDAEDEVRHYM